ncbi:ketoacyl-ACP synthase III [Candidatus Falkowbacteria bacterium]|nr:ketoacyl-ACP synthase III [Candidatus Falkowbacteria bacterium]
MKTNTYSIIVGTGSYIPEAKVLNQDFLDREFYGADGRRLEKSNEQIVKKFEEITETKERRYAANHLVASDIAFYTAESALESSGICGESLDYIIVAHNFGDVEASNRLCNCLPSLAARVKNRLRIRNPKTIVYDILFGCPGWLQGMIQANYFLKSGDAKRILVIGTEILSRVADFHDKDSMLYSDGAGATILEAVESQEPVGMLSHSIRSDTLEHAYLLRMGESFGPDHKGNGLFVKMAGHELYKYALRRVPNVVKESLDKAGLTLQDVRLILLHQANGKMDKAILDLLFGLYGTQKAPIDIMPMTISWLGNNSVATIPIMLDLLFKGKLDGFQLARGDVAVLASVGAGMNINSVVYCERNAHASYA